MDTFSALIALCWSCYQSVVDSPHKDQLGRTLIFFLVFCFRPDEAVKQTVGRTGDFTHTQWEVTLMVVNVNCNRLSEMVTGHNGHKPKRPQPKRPQTETATNRNGHKLERPQTETATNRNGHKPKRPQTGTATNRKGHRPEWPQTKTATSVVTHHISCHQNKYDGESPIGNDDIHARLHRNQLSPE